MEKITFNGIVLICENRRESDRIIKVLTENGSLLRLYAPGAKKPKNRLCAATEPFVCCNFEARCSVNGYILEDSQIISQFYGLRTNITGYALMSYAAKLAAYVFNDNSPQRLYPIFLNMLFLLSEDRADCLTVKAAFEFKTASMCGWLPQIKVCRNCGKPRDSGSCFSIPEGSLYCAECSKSRQYAYPVHESVFRAIDFSVDNNYKKMFLFKLDGAALSSFSALGEKFLEYHAEIKYPELSFFWEIYGSLKNNDTFTNSEI